MSVKISAALKQLSSLTQCEISEHGAFHPLLILNRRDKILFLWTAGSASLRFFSCTMCIIRIVAAHIKHSMFEKSFRLPCTLLF